MNTEEMILKSLVLDKEFCKKALPHLKVDYFETEVSKSIFTIVRDFVTKYNVQPTLDALDIEIGKAPKLNDDSVKSAIGIIRSFKASEKDTPTNLDYLIKTAEEWCQERAIYLALVESLSIADNEHKTLGKGSIPKLLQDALGVAFTSDVGHDYVEGAEDRFDFYKRRDRKVPFNIDLMNTITRGGVPSKTWNMIVAGTNVGKAQPLDTPTPTPNGLVRFGDLKVGDLVFGSDGRSTRINGVFPQGYKDIYRLTFSDGRIVESCGEHLWTIYNPKNGWRTLSVNEILAEWGRNKNKKKRTYVPLTKAVEFEPVKLNIDPYIMGLILGDGSMRHNVVNLTSVDQDIVDQWQSYIRLDGTLDVTQRGITYSVTSKKLHTKWIREALSDYGLMGKLSCEKFIPADYLRSSVSDRYELLRGLMDTDGHICSSNKNTSYCTTSEILAKQVQELVWSLGGRAKISSKSSTYTYKGVKKIGRPAYVVSICMSGSEPIFKLKRKQDVYDQRTRRYDKIRLLKIENIGIQKECMCISVEATDHLYLTTDYIVTHNTLWLCHLAAHYISIGYDVLYITAEMASEWISQRIDMNLLNFTEEELEVIPKDIFMNRVNKKLRVPGIGKLIVQQYAPNTFNSVTLVGLLNELKLKKKIRPKIFIADYIGIMASSTLRMGTNVNSYLYLKTVAEEFRGVMADEDMIGWSATQSNRDGQDSSDINLKNVALSHGLSETSDFMIAVMSTEELQKLNQFLVKQIKNRYNKKSTNSRFIVGVDYDHMRLYNVDQNGQAGLLRDDDDDVLVGKPQTMSQKIAAASKNKFEGFKV